MKLTDETLEFLVQACKQGLISQAIGLAWETPFLLSYHGTGSTSLCEWLYSDSGWLHTLPWAVGGPRIVGVFTLYFIELGPFYLMEKIKAFQAGQ